MPTALITGASSGIGSEIAKCFASDGDDVILLARSQDKLQSLADEIKAAHGVETSVMVADLSQPAAAESVLDELRSRDLVVDHLVNNAGFGDLGDFHRLDAQRQHDMMMVNVVALTMLTRLLIPEMVLRQGGGVLNVGSIAGYQAGPRMAVYYATKAYVMSFTEAIREEYLGSPLHVTLLAPGPTETGFGEDSGMDNLSMFSGGVMPAAEVARAGYDGYRQNKDVVVPGWKNRLMVTSTAFLPRIATRKMVGKLQQAPSS
jgi:short-subunit dehydrogenase